MLQILTGLIARPALLACIALGAVAGTQTWRLHSLQTSIATERAEAHEAARMASQARRDRENASRIATDKAAAHARTKTHDLDTDAADARAAGNGLRLANQAANARIGLASCTSTAGRSDAAEADPLVPADVLARVIDAAVELAAEADRRELARGTCQRIYEAVTGGASVGADGAAQ